MIDRAELNSIWQEVKANSAKLEGCTRHRFPGGRVEKLGDKYACLACGGAMRLTDIGPYIQGYEAAGGNADDIWPNYRKAKT